MSFEILNSLKKDKFTAVNELLSYGKAEDFIHIHVVPKNKVEKPFISFGKGLIKLADIVRNDESVKKIVATSWIVAAHPRILERMGFTIDGEIDEKLRREHFADEKRPVWGAHILREDFLEKYLENKNGELNK